MASGDSPFATRHSTRYSPFATRQSRSQLPIVRMRQKSVRQPLDAFLHPVPQALAHAAALLDGVLVIVLQQAIAGIGCGAGQARAVQQAIEDGKVVEALLLQDLAKIELDVGLAADVGRVAQEAQREPIGDDAPELLAAVQELLDQGVRSEPGATRRGHSSQLLPNADDVHRRGVFSFPGSVGDGEGRPIHLIGARVVAKLVTQKAQ